LPEVAQEDVACAHAQKKEANKPARSDATKQEAQPGVAVARGKKRGLLKRVGSLLLCLGALLFRVGRGS